MIADTTIEETTTGVPKFGDIAPGENLVSWSRPFAISFNRPGINCQPGEYEIGVNIKSNDEVFWYDSFIVVVEEATDIEKENNLPVEFSLGQNFPNPFNPTTKINYSIPEQSYVTLKVFDVLGREVKTLVNKEQPVGNFEVEFNASDFTSGIYFYRIQAGEFVESKKMVLMK